MTDGGTGSVSRGGEAGNSPVLRPEEGGITFREAGLRLGISEKTLRARIKAGEIHAWQVEGKRGKEWRVRLPEVREEGREPEGEGRDLSRSPHPEGREQGRDEARSPSGPSDAIFRELLHRHEEATVRLGYLQAQTDQVKMLAASAEEEKRKAIQAEERARLLEEEKRRAEQKAAEEHEARRQAEEELEDLRRRLGATEVALEGERAKGFWEKLCGR